MKTLSASTPRLPSSAPIGSSRGGGLDGLCLPHAVAYASCALWSKARHYCTLINVDPLASDPRANLIYGMEPHLTIAQANQAAFHGLILREWDKATISQHGALLAKKLKCNAVDRDEGYNLLFF